MSVVVPEETAEELYEHAPCGYLSALPDGTIVRVNQTLLDWTGYSRESLLGRRLRDLLPLPARVFYETHYDPLLRMQGFVREMALDLVCAGGALLPVLISAVQHRDTRGQPLVTRTTIFDATERRTYERELLHARRQAEQLATVVESSADAIVIVSVDGTIQTWNAGAEHMFGYTPAEAIGSRVRDLVVPPESAAEFDQVMYLVRMGQQAQVETVRVRKDGSRVDVSLSLTPHIEPPGELVAISAISRDITERRRIESRLRQAEQLQAVATLAGGVAHEVNNQMTVVLGFGEFVLRSLGQSRSEAQDVRAMVDAAAKVAHLSRQLLAFSRQLPMVGQPVDLHALVDGLVPALTALLGADKRLVVSVNAPTSRVHADPVQLEQVLIQLTSNARDALPAGGELSISIHHVKLDDLDVQSRPGDEVVPGEYVLLSVSDNGVGMDRATLSRAFEPFFTTKPFGQATGLGLAMVHGIVKQHGGHVWGTSESGVGTTIRVYLPIAASEAPFEERPAQLPEHQLAGGGGSS
jgi:PAS domain S-box-containing protein